MFRAKNWGRWSFLIGLAGIAVTLAGIAIAIVLAHRSQALDLPHSEYLFLKVEFVSETSELLMTALNEPSGVPDSHLVLVGLSLNLERRFNEAGQTLLPNQCIGHSFSVRRESRAGKEILRIEGLRPGQYNNKIGA